MAGFDNAKSHQSFFSPCSAILIQFFEFWYHSSVVLAAAALCH